VLCLRSALVEFKLQLVYSQSDKYLIDVHLKCHQLFWMIHFREKQDLVAVGWVAASFLLISPSGVPSSRKEGSIMDNNATETRQGGWSVSRKSVVKTYLISTGPVWNLKQMPNSFPEIFCRGDGRYIAIELAPEQTMVLAVHWELPGACTQH